MDSRDAQRHLAYLNGLNRPERSETVKRQEQQLARIAAELDSHKPIVSARIRQHRHLPPADPTLRS